MFANTDIDAPIRNQAKVREGFAVNGVVSNHLPAAALFIKKTVRKPQKPAP
jgi:hypothetical protein